MSNIYRQKGSKNWYVRVTINKVERRSSLRTPNRAQAEKRAAAEIEALKREHYGDSRHQWASAVVAWHAESGGLKPATVKRYLVSFKAVNDLLEPLFVDQIDKKVLAKIATRKGVTNATRRRDLTAVSVVLHAAEGRGWIENVPLYSRRRLSERRDPFMLPTRAEIERLHARLNTPLTQLVRMLELTGMRLEEAGGLQWQQVDMQRRAITLINTKSRIERTLPMTPELVGIVSGIPRRLGCDWVFWHSREKPKRYTQLSARLAEKRKAAGVAWRIHDLRHFYAVNYLKQGGSIYKLQTLLGHGTITITERYLNHLTPDEQEVAKRMVANAN